MPFAVVTTSAAATGPVSLARAKAHLRVSGTDEDALIADYLAGAVKTAEREAGRQFVTASLKLVLDDFPREGCDEGDTVRLPVGPVQSVTSIVYTDTAGVSQTLLTTDYYVGANTGRIRPATYWPSTRDGSPENVSITYVAGYGAASACPAEAVAAVLLILADRYEHRGDEGGEAERPIPLAALRLLRGMHDGEQW